MKRLTPDEILLLAAAFVLLAAVFWILISSAITREAPELIGRTPTPTVRTVRPVAIGTPMPDIFVVKEAPR